MILKNHLEIKNKIEKVIKRLKTMPAPRELEKFPEQITDHIITSLERGVSPVQGKGRFKDYSDSYKNAIGGRFKRSDGSIVKRFSRKSLESRYGKQVRPVNLKLSGKMYNTIFAKVNARGLVVGFKSRIAYIHDMLGAGKRGIIRRLMPHSTESFSRTITMGLRKAVRDYINRITKL